MDSLHKDILEDFINSYGAETILKEVAFIIAEKASVYILSEKEKVNILNSYNNAFRRRLADKLRLESEA